MERGKERLGERARGQEEEIEEGEGERIEKKDRGIDE